MVVGRDRLLTSALAALRVARRFVRSRYVILHGYYGAGNVGDEAVLAASLEQLDDLPGNLVPFVFCPHPEQVVRAYGVLSLNPLQARRKRVLGVLLRSEAYLLGGGGLLKDYGQPEARSIERQWLQWIDLASRAGLRTMSWSVGVENLRFDRSKQAVKNALEATDLVTVRDEQSAARLREIGVMRRVHVTADPVPWLAQRYARRRSRPTRPRVIAALRHWYPYEFRVPDVEANERMQDAVAHVLDDLVERHGADVAFLPFRTSARDDDREACRAVQARMRAPSVLYDEADPSVEATMARLAEADLVVGMRLHASILATSMGVPTVALAYMPKVRDYMASIGQETLCVDVEAATRERLTEAVDDALKRYEEHSARSLVATSELAARFRSNRELLVALLCDKGMNQNERGR